MVDKPLHLKIVKGHSQKAACPLCEQPAKAPHTPFCSRRCAQLDLVKWLRGDCDSAMKRRMTAMPKCYLLPMKSDKRPSQKKIAEAGNLEPV